MQPSTAASQAGDPDLRTTREEAAAALRSLNDAFVAHQADPVVLQRVRALADELTAQLREGERRDRAGLLAAHVGRIFSADRSRPVPAEAADPMSDRAVGGACNPIAVELVHEYDGDEAVVRTVLGPSYEGAPGRAHGGMVAALFDDVTGFVIPQLGTPAYTGELTIRYHRPVPVETPLELRSRLGRRDGRKVVVTAECHAEGELVASAQALFITVDTSRFGQPGG